jgi:hypothetical protein
LAELGAAIAQGARANKPPSNAIQTEVLERQELILVFMGMGDGNAERRVSNGELGKGMGLREVLSDDWLLTREGWGWGKDEG